MPHQQIDQCIRDCQNTMNRLRSLSNQATNPQVRDMLDESVHHLEMCVNECRFASQRATRQPHYQAYQPTYQQQGWQQQTQYGWGTQPWQQTQR